MIAGFPRTVFDEESTELNFPHRNFLSISAKENNKICSASSEKETPSDNVARPEEEMCEDCHEIAPLVIVSSHECLIVSITHRVWPRLFIQKNTKPHR